MMTEKARQLGMKETNFHNASGLPDPLQITTASDLGVLARHLAYDFPQYFWYFGLSGFNYKGTWYPTHDNLIGRYEGADGIKTGYINASGFNLVSSVVRGGNHIIGVVMGGRTALRRDLEMIRILDDTFAKIAENPTMVASRTVPWHQYGGEAAPVVASLSVAPSTAPAAAPPPAFTPARSRNPFSGLTAMVSPAYAATHAEEDEDAAEKKVAPDEDASILAPVPRPAMPPPAVASAAAPAPNAVKPLPVKGPPPPAVRPAARPTYSPPVAVAVAAHAAPQPRPALRTEAQGEGDTDAGGSPAVPPPSPGHNWTIQIGAYADKALAQAQLAAYADKAPDVLGQASKIVSPAQSADGHTIWRARFGLFAENEARDVCSRLTSRGQTCFAAIAAAR
jgi:D-alanyl-D-alanine carboxypeptidase